MKEMKKNERGISNENSQLMHLVPTQSLGLRIPLQKGPTALEKGLPIIKNTQNFTIINVLKNFEKNTTRCFSHL